MHNLFNDIISENFPHLKNEMENQIQEAYRTPTSRHIIMRMTNTQNKDRILRVMRERKSNYM